MSHASRRIIAWLKRYRLLVVGLGLAALAAVTWWSEARPRPAAEQAHLHDLRSVDDLRAQFNQDAGLPRLILLLSPT